MSSWQDSVVALGSSPWVYLALYVFCAIDGFFPPVPSESLVIALGTTYAAVGVPDVWLVILVAAAGAFTGDQVAYAIGARIKVRSARLFRAAKAQAALDWAEQALRTRGPSFIIAARYVPVGRVAVNMTAGSLHYPRARFTLLVAIAALGWACYGVALGFFAGTFVRDNPLLAIGIGVVAGVVLGLILDPLIRRLTRNGDVDGAAEADADLPAS
jgi:membrane protein DedA with SNARE-associated domain